jgi:cytochrome c oxidase subunit 2
MRLCCKGFPQRTSHIAAMAELWFEKLWLSPSAAALFGIIRAETRHVGEPARIAWGSGPSAIGRDGVLAIMRTNTGPWRKVSLWGALALAILIMPSAAFAALGHPTPWQMGLSDSASPVMDYIRWFHDYVLVIITIVTLFVMFLLGYVMVKFNAKANPVPSRTTHHTGLEVAWTLVPVLILLAIAVPSFKLLFMQLDLPPADITVKATGKQWFWSYTYPDSKFEFDSLMVRDEKDLKGRPRLLAADNALVVPVNKVVRVQVTASDVIHAFAMPAFGVKIDAIPGRLNETWFKATKEGVYYGQCSELCGKDHAFMPIELHVVSEQAYNAWLEDAKKKYASDTPATKVASADAAAR